MTSGDPTIGRRGAVPAAIRFDDMLATVLAQPQEPAGARAVAWRQVVDLLGQRRAQADDPVRDAAYDLLRAVRADVPADTRAAVARSIAGRRLPPELVAFFAEDSPAIATPVLSAARLEDEEWRALLPAFSPTARGIVRNRRDLSAAVIRSLGSFGAHDLVLGAPADAADPVAARPDEARSAASASPPSLGGAGQLRKLMARIDAIRGTAPSSFTPPAQSETETVEAGGFRFETGADGDILWVEDVPRGPVIGLTIAIAAEPSDHGVDRHAASAYARRVAFRDARMSVGGAGPVAGEWRISAVPFFDPVDGRFVGYRGTARRPRPDEQALESIVAGGLYGSALPADALRQLVHELRTPLNAIVGFAEMIEGQLLGPAAWEYRSGAASIAGHGRRLLATVDDLDVSARVETQRLILAPEAVDAAALLARLSPEIERIAAEGASGMDIAIAGALPPIHADPAAAERMYARLLATAVALAAPGESIAIRLEREDAGISAIVALRVTRPRLLVGQADRMLFDPGYSPDGDKPGAPVLGVGFALQLVRNLALAAGGSLDVARHAFVLRLPSA